MSKTAIVTGASRGIGLEIAKSLLEAGYYVLACARSKTNELESLSNQFGEGLVFAQSDIGSRDGRDNIINTAMDKFGKIDLLVNNAGVAPRVRNDMLQMDEESFDYVMNINLKGTYFLTQSAANEMIKSGGGRIVNIGSISADTVSLNRAEYCMSKAGVHMMSQLYAARLAQYNIPVIEICPGVIDTPMIERVKDKYNALAENGTIPARRLGSAGDIANAVLAVAEGRLDYATGTVIRCDGGLHIASL